jgi:DNA-binding NtrC family response regulator
MVRESNFREDLYFRLKVVTVRLPPLRDRREDIPLLVSHILQRIAKREGRSQPPPVSGGAMKALMNHGWPGNVRELENALEHAMVLGREGAILPSHLPPELTGSRKGGSLRAVPLHSRSEKEIITAALEAAGWNRTRTARRLGIDRTTLWRKIKEYGLQPQDD